MGQGGNGNFLSKKLNLPTGIRATHRTLRLPKLPSGVRAKHLNFSSSRPTCQQHATRAHVEDVFKTNGLASSEFILKETGGTQYDSCALHFLQHSVTQRGMVAFLHPGVTLLHQQCHCQHENSRYESEI